MKERGRPYGVGPTLSFHCIERKDGRMHTFCGFCLKRRVCKPAHVPELGGLEDYFCTKCIKELRSQGIKIEILKP